MFKKVLLIALFCAGVAQAATPPATPTTMAPVKPVPGLVEASAKFTEGKEYKLLPATAATQPTAKALLDSHVGKVEVINFFSYGCPVCNRLEPELDKWNQSKKDSQMVVVVDVPVDWNHAGWENLARSFYIAESLGVLAKEHPAMFKAVHQQGKTFKTQADLQEFFLTDVGVSRVQFDDTFDSFNVRRRLKQGELLRNEYAVMAIPAFIVNGKYYIDVQTAGGMKQAIDVLDYLVSKESFTKGTEDVKFDEVSPATVPTTTKPQEPLAPSAMPK
jgi:thiol:disulfide interchange protein DsbA